MDFEGYLNCIYENKDLMKCLNEQTRIGDEQLRIIEERKKQIFKAEGRNMEYFKQIMNEVIKLISENENFTAPTISLWFKDLILDKVTSTSAVILVEDSFKYGIIMQKYEKVIKKYLEQVLGYEVDLTFEVIYDDELENIEKINIIDKEPPKSSFEYENEDDEDAKSGSLVEYKAEYTFDNFVVGNTNKYVYAACKSVATDQEYYYNPLFIYGPSGVGKTHLLYAITNEILQKDKNTRVLYIRGEDFANEFINLIMKKSPMQYFRERYRNVDVLLVDDIQFIAGKNSTMEEFFHTFNALYDMKKRIILASDRSPKDINALEDRLRTRFEWGLVIEVTPPDFELRKAILKNKCDAVNLKLSDTMLNFMSDSLKGNIRQLEGAVKRILARSTLSGEEITLDIVKDCLKDLITGNVSVGVTIDQIFESVSKRYNVPISEIKGKKRTKDIALARHVTIYILSNLTNLSLNEIGSYMGGLNHSSIHAAKNNIKESIKTDPKLEYDVTNIIREIKNI